MEMSKQQTSSTSPSDTISIQSELIFDDHESSQLHVMDESERNRTQFSSTHSISNRSSFSFVNGLSGQEDGEESYPNSGSTSTMDSPAHHHESTIRSVAAQVLHHLPLTRRMGSVADLAAAIVEPILTGGTAERVSSDSSSSSSSSSSESDSDEDADERNQPSPDFMVSSSESSEDEDHPLTNMIRTVTTPPAPAQIRSIRSITEPIINNDTNKEHRESHRNVSASASPAALLLARRMAARKRLPSYPHLFPQPTDDKATHPIEGHGIIGNCHTTALVSSQANICWFSYPHHDSPTIFHSLIDEQRGGYFKITAGREIGSGHTSHVTTKQLYHTETNVLLTRFFADSGVGHVTDYMCIGDAANKFDARHWLVRELEVVRGKMYFEVECKPQFNYGRDSHAVNLLPYGALFVQHTDTATGGLSMLLTSSKQRIWKQTRSGGVKTMVKLEEGQRVIFVLREWCEEDEKRRWEEERKNRELMERQRQFIQEQLEKLDLDDIKSITTDGNSPANTNEDHPELSRWNSTTSSTPTLSTRSLSSRHPDYVRTQSVIASEELHQPIGLPPPLVHSTTHANGPHSLYRRSSKLDLPHTGESFGLHTIRPISTRVTDKLRRTTMEFWRSWVGKCPYEGRWRETMRRSALLLKLLTFQPTGAIISAPTCGLPSVIGIAGHDARYVNLRDASLAASAFLRLGFRNEASAFMAWLSARCRESQAEDGSLHYIYSIHGQQLSNERPTILRHITGYKHSGPIRIGPTKAQRSWHMYGTLLISIYLSNLYAEPISFEFWKYTRKLVNYVCDHWREPDEGLWSSEIESEYDHSHDDDNSPVDATRDADHSHRSPLRQYVVSKIMCWVCVDRGIKLAHERSFPAPFNTWKRIRDEIYFEVQDKGYNKEKSTFVQVMGETSLDAALLLMPVTGFIAPTDPKFISTLDTITRSVNVDGLTSNSLIHRTNATTDLPGTTPQATTSICTFWAIEACTRAGLADARYLNRARLLMEQMLGYANHLGLFSECIGLRGDFLGNFPHLSTHVSLTRAAMYLNLALDKQKPHTIVEAMISDMPSENFQAPPIEAK